MVSKKIRKLVARVIRGHRHFGCKLDSALRDGAKPAGDALVELKAETGERFWNAVYAIVRKVGKTKLSDIQLHRYKTIAEGWPILCKLAGSDTPDYAIKQAVALLSQEGAPPIITDPTPPAPTIIKLSPGKEFGRPTGQIFHCEGADGCSRLDPLSIPLTLTSPPWGGMRLFGGHKWDFETFKRIADQLWRVTADRGVVCWAIADEIVDGGFTLASHRQALYFQDLGFKCHQIITIKTNGRPMNSDTKRYNPVSYVYVWSKGEPKTVYLHREPNKDAGKRNGGTSRRDKAGTTFKQAPHVIGETGIRSAVWEIPVGWHNASKQDAWTRVHPARMPEILATLLIEGYSAPGDLVLDPMVGIGTTCVAAKKLGRRWLGFDIWEEAADWAQERMRLLTLGETG